MNILVFVKQVVDSEARILVSEDRKSLTVENKYNINFFDEFAIEEAIRIKEKDKASTVTVCTLGAAKAVEALKTAIAMGADRAFRLDNTNVAIDDPLIVARVLAAFAKKEPFDMILCGRQAIDDENGSIGAMVAEFLGLPHVGFVSKLDFVDATARAECEVEGGKATLEVDLPALFTVQKGINEPRVPLITGVMKAMKAVIPTEDPAALGLSVDDIGQSAAKITFLSYDPPAGRPPVKIIEGATPEEKAKALIQVLKEEARAL